MENSKTGKAAEADLIIGIGRNITTDPSDRTRTLCVAVAIADSEQSGPESGIFQKLLKLKQFFYGKHNDVFS